MGELNWPTLSMLALVHLAAGNDNDYRNACVHLVDRNSIEAPEALRLITLVSWRRQCAGRHATGIGIRRTLGGGQQCHRRHAVSRGRISGRPRQAPVAKLAKALAQFETASDADEKPRQAAAVRLVGTLVLSDAAQLLAGRKAQQKQVEALEEGCGRRRAGGRQGHGRVAPRAMRTLIEIANRQLARLSTAAEEPATDDAATGS